MDDAHLKVGVWHDTTHLITNDHGERYRKLVCVRESIYCRVKRQVKFYRWVKVAE